MSDQGSPKIKRLEDSLYSRNAEALTVREHELRHTPDPGLPPHEPPVLDVPERTKKRISPIAIFLLISVVFFVGASAYAAFKFFGQGNSISGENISIGITGPTAIRGGDELSFDVVITNNNSIPLELADLLVDFPDGTRTPGNLAAELLHYRETLGTLKPGESVRQTVRGVLFGEEQAKKTIKVTYEYRIAGSNAIFYKEAVYDLLITSSPLVVSIETPTETNSGQDISIQATVSSNASEVVRDVLLVLEYPPGFSFKSATPSAFFENRVFSLGDVKPGSKRVITIRGSLSGEADDVRVFRFTSGSRSVSNERQIEAPLASLTKEVTIKKPFIALSLSLAGKSDKEVTIESGAPIRVDLSYVNNLPIGVSDVVLSLKLAGKALERTSVSPDRGFYRSLDDTVLWDKTTLPELGFLAPGASGTVSLTFNTLDIQSGILSLRNPSVTFTGSVAGTRSEGSSVPGEALATVSGTAKVASDVGLKARLIYYDGSNTGPMPPKADKETTYTVVLSMTNGSNDIADGLVTMTLPSYVRYISSTSDQVTYTAVGGRVSWSLGEVKAGTGFNTAPKEVSFKIGFTPGLSQVGGAPVLLNGIQLTSKDRYTGEDNNLSIPAVTTRLTNDPGSKGGDDSVVK
jgi:hypothetical protein